MWRRDEELLDEVVITDSITDGSADFIFIMYGPTNVTQFIPQKANIRVVSRPSSCFDLGVHGEVLRKDALWKKYNRFITLNSSIRGPFMPYWSRSCWSDAFLDHVTDEVKVDPPNP